MTEPENVCHWKVVSYWTNLWSPFQESIHPAKNEACSPLLLLDNQSICPKQKRFLIFKEALLSQYEKQKPGAREMEIYVLKDDL